MYLLYRPLNGIWYLPDFLHQSYDQSVQQDRSLKDQDKAAFSIIGAVIYHSSRIAIVFATIVFLGHWLVGLFEVVLVFMGSATIKEDLDDLLDI